MFENIGGKIKTLATVCTIIGIVVSIAVGIFYGAEADFLAGLLIIILGCLSSWIGSFLLYGFGELIENTTEIRKNMIVSRVVDKPTSRITKNTTITKTVVPTAHVNTEERDKETRYQFALDKISRNDYQSAYNILVRLGDYKDSKTYLAQAERELNKKQ